MKLWISLCAEFHFGIRRWDLAACAQKAWDQLAGSCRKITFYSARALSDPQPP